MDISGFGWVRLEHLILDYNGTLALDGELSLGVEPLLAALAPSLNLHVVTTHNHDTAAQRLVLLFCQVHLLGPGDEIQAKLQYVRQLGEFSCVCLGNGRNDSCCKRRIWASRCWGRRAWSRRR
ncbi:hypothetical protein DFAR_1310023 [Desulfarculales bacterium]